MNAESLLAAATDLAHVQGLMAWSLAHHAQRHGTAKLELAVPSNRSVTLFLPAAELEQFIEAQLNARMLSLHAAGINVTELSNNFNRAWLEIDSQTKTQSGG